MLARCRPSSFITPAPARPHPTIVRSVVRAADPGSRTWPNGDSTKDAPAADSSASDEPKPTSLLQKIKRWIFGGPLDKERLKSLGLGAFLAYGFVSNVTYGACFTIGWASHVAATGVTPFGGGQFGPFLGRVAGLLALQQLLRPLRFSCAMALTPVVDRMLQWVQRRMGFSRRNAFICLFVGLALLTFAGYGVALTTVTVWNMPK